MPHTSNRPVDWEALVTDNENRLYRAALAILGDPQEAEDAVQDAFLVFLEKAPADLEHPGAWLMRVLVNGCRSRLRLAWRRVGPLPDTLPAPAPEERAELEELFSLPPADRAVIHLFYYEGCSTQEIAHMTGQRPGTVRSRLTRAKMCIRDRILEVAQGLHQHQSGLGGGDGLVAAVGGGAHAAGDAVGVAGGHIGLGPGAVSYTHLYRWLSKPVLPTKDSPVLS